MAMELVCWQKYSHASRVKEEMASVQAMFADLRSSVETLVFHNGKSENLICLTGPIPAMYKGQRYNIPICIYLLTPHPDCAPFVYVRPPPGTTINPGLHLDATGRVYLPYLHDWKKPTHDLRGLIQIMVTQFGEELPSYSCTGSYIQPPPFVAGTPNGPMQQSINILGFNMANITVSQDNQKPYPSFNSILNGLWQGPSNHHISPKPGSSGEKSVLHQNLFPPKPNTAIPQPSHTTEHNQHISPPGGSDKRDPGDGLYENVVLNPQTSSQSDKPPPVPERKHSSSKLAAIRVDKWSQMNRGECYKMHILLRSDDEFKRVVANIAANGGSSWVDRIKQIRRIENRRLHRLYQTDLEEMERCNEKGFQNERILWHGTDDDALKNIVRDGFNRGYCGKHAAVYGDGVYFAVNFEYSAKSVYSPRNDKGLKFILQCRVLTGHFTQGSRGLKEPPMRTDEFRFDSVVDDVRNPTMFVIFKDMKVYPEYSISVE